MKSHFTHTRFNKVTILVTNKYKLEELTDTLEIYTIWGETVCGVNFKLNQAYIVYGFFRVDDEIKEGISFWTNLCTRTQEFGKKESKMLRRLKRKNKKQ